MVERHQHPRVAGAWSRNEQAVEEIAEVTELAPKHVALAANLGARTMAMGNRRRNLSLWQRFSAPERMAQRMRRSISATTSATHSSIEPWVVSMRSSGDSGDSYGALIPLKSGISPARALA